MTESTMLREAAIATLLQVQTRCNLAVRFGDESARKLARDVISIIKGDEREGGEVLAW